MIMCALDFCRALRERGWFWNLVFRLAVGRYAYREYELLKLNLEAEGYLVECPYGLEDMEYHNKSIEQIAIGMLASLKSQNWERKYREVLSKRF